MLGMMLYYHVLNQRIWFKRLVGRDQDPSKCPPTDSWPIIAQHFPK